ncbi:MAG: glycosyltransferase family 39 protein [Deltaproteobacteria bacterium]|nr:MAG: glycosyltransferase family 39 protein [Deltaproteobacteria bacterium]
MTGAVTSDHENHRANRVLLGLALAYFLLAWIPSFAGTAGYFIDETYFIACSERLAFGYVDQPPLSILLLRLVRASIGDSLPALRLVPSVAGAAVVFLTGFIARRLGADTFGQALAAGTAMLAPVYHVLFGYYSMNALSVLLWAVCFWLLVEIERRDEPRLWLGIGAVAGLGLENKHTIVLLALGLAVGLLLTPARRHLASRWLWLGLGIAALVALPNLLWQLAHGWPSLAFYRNADAYKNVPTAPLEVLAQQLLAANPAALPVWLAGLGFFLATERGRPYRHLGWIYVALLVLLLVGQKSRPDRIAAAYTVLFAGGGAGICDWLRRPGMRWLRPAQVAVLLLCGAALAPLSMPLLPPRLTARYAAALGVVPQIERGEDKRSLLPQWLADRYGWPALVDDVERVVRMLEPAERSHAIILAASYGHAGPIELLGRGRNLPPVYSPHNSYFLWGPPPDPVDVAVVIGFGEPGATGVIPEEPLASLFAEIELARVHDCEWCMRWRDGMPIWIARGPTSSFREAWPDLMHFQ